ncbi:MAG TPA: aminoglycoside phosphotransferase family protein [Novosphingobium sp.]
MRYDSVQLPHDPAGIDAQFLTDALRAGGSDARITGARIVDMVRGTCTKMRVALDYAPGSDPSLPPTMVIKTGFEPHSERMDFMYQQEARFYAELAPRLGLNVPRAFYAGRDPDSWRALVLMEDLVRRDVEFCSAQRPFDFAHLARRLRMLAGMHARTWASPDVADDGALGWVQMRFSPTSWAYNNYYLEPETWQRFIDSPRGAAVSRRLHDREWMRHALERLAELEAGDPLCIIHGDTHPGNLYLDADGTPGFLDPMASRASWWLEVAYHVVASLDIADRRGWEQALLAGYLRDLAEFGVSPPTFDEAWLRYRQSIAYGYFIFIINETKFQPEAVNTAYTARFGIAAVDHDIFALLK